jgi:hypothetical protein
LHVAGQAALDRLSKKLWTYDVATRAIPIGRPQSDHLDDHVPFEGNGRTVVFYAPTWEGDRPTMAYGSIASHGVAIAEAVLASSTHRLIFRPHPRSGVNSREYREANQRIQAMIGYATCENVCRSRYLLRYFGEANDHDCGHCDVCLSRRRGGLVSEPRMNSAMEQILQLISDGKPHPITDLRDIQLPTAELDAALDYLMKEEYVRQADGLLVLV